MRYEEKIPIEKVHANNWNTNYMIENEKQALQKEIDSVGVLKPLILWLPKPDYYEIIDGEQRWVYYRELKRETVEGIIWEEAEVEKIKASVAQDTGKPCTPELLIERLKVISHNLNEIKGSPSIQRIMEHYKNTDAKEIYDRHLKFNMAKLRELLEQQQAGIDISKLMPGRGGRDFMVFQYIIKGDENIGVVKQAIDKAAANNRNEAFLRICREFVVKP